MTLRICDNGTRRFLPASPEAVEATFTTGAFLGNGTEITLADGDRWLMAFVVGRQGDPGEFFLSGYAGGTWVKSDRVSRSEALRQFRLFLET